MKFSIIIPTFNAEDRIRKVLDSIACQTYKDYECIVVCDSCADNTAAIARTYGERFKVLEVNHGNDGLTRSTGLDHATGEWVLFLDDDDWWMHEYVLEQLAERAGNAHEDILCFSFIWKGIGYANPLSNAGYLFPSVWNKCWRRDFIGETRFPNVYPDSDAYFHMEMMQKKPRLAIWDMPMYYYNYLREGSISNLLGRTIQTVKDYWEGDEPK